jgi:hypothetical protein
MKLEAGSTATVYSRHDEAFGPASDWKAYAETLDDSHLEPVGTPKPYTMRVLSRKQADEIKISALCKRSTTELPEKELGLRMMLAIYDACFDDAEAPFEVRLELGSLASTVGSLSRPTPSP